MGLGCTQQTSCFPGPWSSGLLRRGRKGKAAACSSVQSTNTPACPAKLLLDLFNEMCLHGNIVRTRRFINLGKVLNLQKSWRADIPPINSNANKLPWCSGQMFTCAFCGEGLLPDSGGQMWIRALRWGPFSTYKAALDIWLCGVSSMVSEFPSHVIIFCSHQKIQHLGTTALNQGVLGCSLGALYHESELHPSWVPGPFHQSRSARPGPGQDLGKGTRKRPRM